MTLPLTLTGTAEAMLYRAGISLAITVAALLAGTPVAGQNGDQNNQPGTPAGKATDKTTSPWNTSTTRDPDTPPPPAASDSTLSLRVYDGVNSRNQLPYRPRQPDDPAYAVDVSAIMSRCADGSIVIKALLIGGHLTPLDNRCDAEPPPDSSKPAPVCDPNTWNCGPKPAK